MRMIILSLAALSLVGPVSAQEKAPPPLRHQPAPAVLDSTYNEVHKYISSTFIGTVPSNWSEWLNRFDGKLKSRGELRAVLDVMTSAPGDAQLHLLLPKEVELLKCRPVSGYVGLGVKFKMVYKLNEGLEIDKVIDDGPACAAQLRSGGMIVAVNGTRLSGLSYPEALTLLKSEENSMLLTVREGDKENEYNVTSKDGKLGIQVKPSKTTFHVSVSKVLKGSPAEAAGIKVGETITRVNTESIEKLDPEWFMERATYGKLGDSIGLTVLRDGKLVYLEIKRGIVIDEELAYGFSSNDNGSTLRLTNLDWMRVAEVVDRHIGDINERECTIDLRGASGDDAALAARVAARFVSEGELFVIRTRNSSGEIESVCYYVERTNGQSRLLCKTSKPGSPMSATLTSVVEVIPTLSTAKLTILVDERTSGTAEALARVLQKNVKATVAGVTTAGRANIVSTKVFTADDTSFYVTVPVASFVRDKGESFALTPGVQVNQASVSRSLLSVLCVIGIGSLLSLLVASRGRKRGLSKSRLAAGLVLSAFAGAGVGYFLKVDVSNPASQNDAQKAAAYINKELLSNETIRTVNFLRNAPVGRGKRDAEAPGVDREKDVISEDNLKGASRLVSAACTGDAKDFQAIVANYIYMPHARAQIGSAIEHAMGICGVHFHMAWYIPEFLGIEQDDLVDGSFSVFFSPKEGVQPRVFLQTQHPRYDQYQMVDSTLVTAEEVMRTISMGILRDARRAERLSR